jgi:signal peptidase II
VTTSRRIPLVASILAASVGLDQATKRMATAWLVPGELHAWLGDLFRLQYAENRGAFLSLGAWLSEDARFGVFVVAVGVLLAGMLLVALLDARLGALEVAGFACFVGGGVSNWIDRVFHHGRVVDFMNLGIGRLRTGIFNVADVVLIVGVGLMLLGRRRAGLAGPAAPERTV